MKSPKIIRLELREGAQSARTEALERIYLAERIALCETRLRLLRARAEQFKGLEPHP